MSGSVLLRVHNISLSVDLVQNYDSRPMTPLFLEFTVLPRRDPSPFFDLQTLLIITCSLYGPSLVLVFRLPITPPTDTFEFPLTPFAMTFDFLSL